MAAPGEPAYRWHWDTPIMLSPHDSAIVYVAANRVFRAPDRGLTFTPISPDLTTGEDSDRERIVTMGLKGSDITIAKNDGIVAFGTIVALAESPKTAGRPLRRHRRRPAAGDEGRRQGLDRRLPEAAERAEGRVRVARGAVALRRRHGLRRRSTITA